MIGSIDHFNQQMNASDLLTYRVATTEDCASLTILVNNSYRSELAEQGWTNENNLVDGPRTNPDNLVNTIDTINSIILVFFDKPEQILVGCVYLEHKPEIKTAFLGMLAVRPDLQTRGYGKFIMSVAEKYATSKWNVDYIELKAIIQRRELVSYYNRRGYTDIGDRIPFHPPVSCHTKRDDLEFCTMRKCVRMNEEKISA